MPLEINLASIEPILTKQCEVINEISHDNINAMIDNLEFKYKIFVQPKVTYFKKFYYPQLVLQFNLFQSKIALFYLQNIAPKFNVINAAISSRFNIYKQIIIVKIGEVKLSITNSSLYKVYIESRLNKFVSTIHEILSKLLENSNFERLNKRKHFLVKEFKNLVHWDAKSNPKKSNRKKLKIDHSNVADVAKDILDDSGYYDYGSDSEFEDDDDDLEPIIIKVTSTIYEVMGTALPIEMEINQLLDNFEVKINKTMDLALINISNEINPKINSTIDHLKPELTEIFKFIQKENYNYYKQSHEMIGKIDKDLSNLKEYGIEKYNETISRQDMRDIIEKCKYFNTLQFDKIESKINANFEQLINSYLGIIQDTIDILESFADSAFTNFSNELTHIISSSDNEEFNWKSWKRFHALKTSLLDKRDFIFDQANILKAKQFNKLEIDSDFKNWLKLISEINMHLNFLHQDNQEYLQLIRAKANVSYQLREAEVDKQLKSIDNNEPVDDEAAKLPADDAQPADVSILPVGNVKNEDVSILPVDVEESQETIAESSDDGEPTEVEDTETETETKTTTVYSSINHPKIEDIDDIEVDQDPDFDDEDV